MLVTKSVTMAYTNLRSSLEFMNSECKRNRKEQYLLISYQQNTHPPVTRFFSSTHHSRAIKLLHFQPITLTGNSRLQLLSYNTRQKKHLNKIGLRPRPTLLLPLEKQKSPLIYFFSFSVVLFVNVCVFNKNS